MQPEVISLSSSVSTHHQEEQKKHRGDETYTNVHEFPLPSRGLVDYSLPSAKANLCEHVKCCPQFLNIEDSLVYHVPFPKQPLDARSLIGVMQRLSRRSHCLGLEACLLMMLMDWAICQTQSITSLSIRCVVKPPLTFTIRMVSGALWLTPTPTFSAQMQTCCVGIFMVLAPASTDYGNQKALHYILCSQWWSMIEWWVSNAGYSKQAS